MGTYRHAEKSKETVKVLYKMSSKEFFSRSEHQTIFFPYDFFSEYLRSTLSISNDIWASSF